MTLATPAIAIPSPDLVISLGASLSQVLGLVLVLAGGFVYARRRSFFTPEAHRSSPWPFRIVLGLLVLTIVLFAMHWVETRDRDRERLRTNLFRTARQDGKVVGDVTLKTLTYSEQIQHPRAITTGQLEQWIEDGKPLNLIDVRETEEVELGHVPGAWHRRYPDLQADRTGLVVDGKQTVLVCYSGNRSSELVDEFLPLGFECLFLIGGCEKWVAEGRALEGAPEARRAEIREVADYPNRDVLIDTDEFRELVETEKATILDVRYPREFEEENIAGAVNLPVRRMLSAEIDAAIRALPRRPVVIACYDKRGSFFGLVLGLRLQRAGHDYRGRYTVPHEYFVPKGDRPYVEAWRKANENPSLYAVASTFLDHRVSDLRGVFGHLLLAVLVLVAGVRLLLLPLTVKSERDQVVQRQLKAVVAGIRADLRGDRRAISREILELNRRHALTPARNFLASSVQIGIFLMLFGAVDAAAGVVGASERFLWIPAIGAPDPLAILPAAVALLFGALVLVPAGRPSRGRVVTAIVVASVLFALSFHLRAAVVAYLALNGVFLLLHGRIVRGSVLRGQARKAAEAAEDRVVPLERAHEVAGTGNKAARLGRMIVAGLPVPPGFVLTAKAAGPGGADTFADGVAGLLDRAWRKLGASRVAVRSSGLREDGEDKSYAGAYDTVLNVDRASFSGAVGKVRDSLGSGGKLAGGGSPETGGVVVQEMVDATHAGVLFTEHPADGGALLVEMVEGLGESLVSGRATPRSFAFARVTGARLSGGEPPIDLGPLIGLGRRLETLFGRPQDVEWAFAGGRFHLLQSRDITASIDRSDPARSARRREQGRLLSLAAAGAAGDVLFAQNEITELLPAPTPFSEAFMQALWAHGGSVDLACRRLGVPYPVAADSPPLLVGVFGRLCVNRREERRRARKALGTRAAFRFARWSDDIEREWRGSVLPRLLRGAAQRNAVDFGKLEPIELIATFVEWRDRFVKETYVDAECINVLAEFHLKNAEHRLRDRGLDPAAYLSRLPRTVVHEAFEVLAGVREGTFGHREFKRLFGHRAPLDFELAQPRYGEDPDQVLALAQRTSGRREAPAAAPPLPARHRILALEVGRACRFQALKEEAKHHALRDLAALRALLLELGRRTGIGEGIFQLTPDEVAALDGAGAREAAPALAVRRREERRALLEVDVPTEITIGWLEALDRPAPARIVTDRTAGAVLAGTRVAGSGEVVGPARVLTGAAEIDTFVAGEILVARFTDPTWTPVFPRARGIVTEVGGWLSHAAIQARECGIAGVVGVRGALDALATGDVLRLGTDGTVERIPERRSECRTPCHVAVRVEAAGASFAAWIEDVSPLGARVSAPGHTPVPGETWILRTPETGESVEATVARAVSGAAGLRLSEPVGRRLAAASQTGVEASVREGP